VGQKSLIGAKRLREYFRHREAVCDHQVAGDHTRSLFTF